LIVGMMAPLVGLEIAGRGTSGRRRAVSLRGLAALGLATLGGLAAPGPLAWVLIVAGVVAFSAGLLGGPAKVGPQRRLSRWGRATVLGLAAVTGVCVGLQYSRWGPVGDGALERATQTAALLAIVGMAACALAGWLLAREAP
jgi:hypothetical protein